MKKIILCILTCLILTCCNSQWTEDNIEYYKVENFKIISEGASAYVQVVRETYVGKLNIYEMDLIKDCDTIHETYVTTRKERFIKGDSIYLWYDKWLLKD